MRTTSDIKILRRAGSHYQFHCKKGYSCNISKALIGSFKQNAQGRSPSLRLVFLLDLVEFKFNLASVNVPEVVGFVLSSNLYLYLFLLI